MSNSEDTWSLRHRHSRRDSPDLASSPTGLQQSLLIPDNVLHVRWQTVPVMADVKKKLHSYLNKYLSLFKQVFLNGGVLYILIFKK